MTANLLELGRGCTTVSLNSKVMHSVSMRLKEINAIASLASKSMFKLQLYAKYYVSYGYLFEV